MTEIRIRTRGKNQNCAREKSEQGKNQSRKSELGEKSEQGKRSELKIRIRRKIRTKEKSEKCERKSRTKENQIFAPFSKYSENVSHFVDTFSPPF